MIIISFLAILLLTFGVMAFATKPSQGQQVLEQRMIDIRSSRVD